MLTNDLNMTFNSSRLPVSGLTMSRHTHQAYSQTRYASCPDQTDKLTSFPVADAMKVEES